MRKTLTQAILAAFCAILTPLLEGGGVMIPLGLHMGIRKEAAYTAKDYVQDGLIGMWDGIENTGWEAHDSSATTWVDLSGNGNDMVIRALTSVAYWEDNGFRYNKTELGGVENYFHIKSAPYFQSQLGSNFSMGFVATIYPTDDISSRDFLGDAGDGVDGVRISRNNGVISFYLYGYQEQVNILCDTDLPLNPSLPYKISLSFTCCDGVVTGYAGKKTYQGGVLPRLPSQQGFCIGSGYDYKHYGYSPISSHVFLTPLACFHRAFVMGRPLTAEEIAYNYSIDKARFGL